MSNLRAIAENATRKIDEIDRRADLLHSRGWLLRVTAEVQVAIEEATDTLITENYGLECQVNDFLKDLGGSLEREQQRDALVAALRPFAERFEHLSSLSSYSGKIDVPVELLKCASETLAEALTGAVCAVTGIKVNEENRKD